MKILIADGDQLFARLMRTKLERWGHRVQVETDGESAYRRIQREPFRMVFLDWDLPGMSGPDLCAAIRRMRRARYTYIIFYTARSDKDSILAGLEAGADDYLTKPLNTVELRLRMKNGKRLLNLEDELREGAGLDIATGCVNRASMEKFFKVVLAESRRTENPGVLMSVLVSNYHLVMQSVGFSPAQSMMAELASVFDDNLRESDLVSRINDDQFLLMLQNTDAETSQAVADKIRLRTDNLAVQFEDIHIRPEIQMHVTQFPAGDRKAGELMEQALSALEARDVRRSAPGH